MKRGEWKVDVNIGFWKCWAIFRADTKSISWSSRNEMICPFWWSGYHRRCCRHQCSLWVLMIILHNHRLSLIEKLTRKENSSNSFLIGKSWLLRNQFCCQMCQLSPALIFWQKIEHWKATQRFFYLHFTQLQLIMKKHLDLSTRKKKSHTVTTPTELCQVW